MILLPPEGRDSFFRDGALVRRIKVTGGDLEV